MIDRRTAILLPILITALTAGCANHTGPALLPAPAGPSVAVSHGSKTFRFTHAFQRFRVPSGVTQLAIKAYGAQGGGPSKSSAGYPGGRGAAVKATVPVKPMEELYVLVGGRGILNTRGGGGGGFNGGGAGGSYGYGGGGSSDVRVDHDRLADRIVIAAGGGGSGQSVRFATHRHSGYWVFGGAGGAGGAARGSPGKKGSSASGIGGGGGGGAMQTAGGGGGEEGGGSSYGCYGADGTPGILRIGGTGGGACTGRGSGGGGGYYGGGGGGSAGSDPYRCEPSYYCIAAGGGGGGGGSSWVEKSATSVHEVADAHSGNGEIIISW